jgi:hypothetical protein
MEEGHRLGGGQRRDGVPRRGITPPCGKAVPVGGRRRRRTGVAGRLGRVKVMHRRDLAAAGFVRAGPCGGVQGAVLPGGRAGVRIRIRRLGLSLWDRPRAYTTIPQGIVGMNVSLCILNHHSRLHFLHARRLIQLCPSPPPPRH